MHYYYGNMMGWGGGIGILGVCMMVVFWVMVIALVVWVIRMIVRGGRMGHWHGHSHAVEILNERYAKGEITKEEYEAKKKDILNI